MSWNVSDGDVTHHRAAKERLGRRLLLWAARQGIVITNKHRKMFVQVTT